MHGTWRRSVGLGVGVCTAVAMAAMATLLARTLWPAYAAAEPSRAYSGAMLIGRLLAGALCTAGAACAATRIAQDHGTVAWWLGGLFLGVSAPHHLLQVWAAYPVWYHVVYLSYLVPIAGLTGQLASRSAPVSVFR